MFLYRFAVPPPRLRLDITTLTMSTLPPKSIRGIAPSRSATCCFCALRVIIGGVQLWNS